jgi:hypothetical protein
LLCYSVVVSSIKFRVSNAKVLYIIMATKKQSLIYWTLKRTWSHRYFNQKKLVLSSLKHNSLHIDIHTQQGNYRGYKFNQFKII